MDNVRFPIFRERFSQLRGDMKQDEFAEFLGFSRPTVALYESGKRVPDAVALKTIAEKCKVSADWLLGLSEAPTDNRDDRFICDSTGLSFEALGTLRFDGRQRAELNTFIENSTSIVDALNSLRADSLRLKAVIEKFNVPGLLGAPSDFRSFELSPDSCTIDDIHELNVEHNQLQFDLFQAWERFRSFISWSYEYDFLDIAAKKLIDATMGMFLQEGEDDGKHIEASDN